MIEKEVIRGISFLLSAFSLFTAVIRTKSVGGRRKNMKKIGADFLRC